MTVLEVLAEEGPLYPAEIAAAVGKRPESIRAYLCRLVRQGQVTKLPDGRYITSDGTHTPPGPELHSGDFRADEDALEIERWRREVQQLEEELGACFEEKAELEARVEELEALLGQETERVKQLARENGRLARELEEAKRTVTEANLRYVELFLRYDGLLQGNLSSKHLDDLLRRALQSQIAATARRLVGS